MIRRQVGLCAGASALALLACAALPDLASAHGLVGKQDLPIPKWLFAWAAAIVLVATFAGLATLWPTPRLQQPRERVVARVPRWLEPLAGTVGVALFVVCVYAGLAGEQDIPTSNLMVTVVFVIFWVGLPFASVLFGDVFRAFNPWRAIGRLVGWIAHRALGEPAEPLPYPARLGRWPAVLGILAFAWVELVYGNKDDPSTLAVLALVYAAIQFVGMGLYGVRAWEHNGDAFAVYFGLFARLSPLHWSDGELRVRRPLEGVVGLDTPPGTVALLVTMIGTTSFDGFSQGQVWTSIEPRLQSAFTSLGLGPEAAIEAAFTVGLVVAVLLVAALYRLGVEGMHTVRPSDDPNELARRFVHTLVPIALAYVVAHYFSLLVYQSQALDYLVSDPLGHGSDLFGTAGSGINYGIITATAVWYVQVAALLGGHVGGLVLAHDRAVAFYRSPQAATRSQYWMLGVMVTFTSLGLWLLSSTGQ
ncbi:MAG: hypothetical protein QOE86_3414 [Solirubrobacteraceae bacterium]|nr:hypothetical protein [Solirubrobacteraceae bacterium]